eukprot:3795242-Pleurochrysis_carterae.AAC.2
MQAQWRKQVIRASGMRSRVQLAPFLTLFLYFHVVIRVLHRTSTSFQVANGREYMRIKLVGYCKRGAEHIKCASIVHTRKRIYSPLACLNPSAFMPRGMSNVPGAKNSDAWLAARISAPGTRREAQIHNRDESGEERGNI